MNVLMEAGNIIRKNKDSTPEDIVNTIIDDCATELNQIIQTSSVPGIVSSLQVDNININLYGVRMGPNGDI